MSFVPAPVLDDARSGPDLGIAPDPATLGLPASRERTTTLLLEVENADPTGEIRIGLEAVGPGEASFRTASPPGGELVLSGDDGPAFVAVDPDEAYVFVGADPAADRVDFALQLAVRGSADLERIALRVDAAPGTGIEAVIGDRPAVPVRDDLVTVRW